MNSNYNSHDNDIDMDQDKPLDLKGSEQHHKLKNKEGEKGDPNHASDDAVSADEIDQSLKDAVTEGKEDTEIGSAMGKAVDD